MGTASPWKRLYNSARWRKLRIEVFVRDNYTCQMCKRICGGKFPADDSPEADHKQPHRGNEDLFFDPTNLQTLCKFPCHAADKQREEQDSVNTRGVWY